MIYSIEIQNLKCGGCANTILHHLEKINSINEISVDLAINTVSFFSEDITSLPMVEAKLSEIGYPPVGSKNSVITKAKSFVSCATGKMTSS